MTALIDVILPVFLVIGAGYAAAWGKVFSAAAADGLMIFAQRFAIPCLLFQAIAGIDLGADFDPALLTSFYAGVGAAFVLGGIGARVIFHRPPQDCVAIGFGAAFSNSVLLGLPIMERAYGSAALAPSYTIVSFHAPIIYTVGIIAMEMVKGRGRGLGLSLIANVLKSIFSNALVIGILAGFAANIWKIDIPNSVDAATSMVAEASLPAALFALGAILKRYRPEGDLRVIAMLATLSLVVHPSVTWFVGTNIFTLTDGQLRAAIVTAAMAPGINTFVFANMYGAAKRVAASSVLICTILSLFSAWAWLSLLP